MRILILNGPNLNLLGKRQPDIYGKQSFEDYFKQLVADFSDTRLDYEQSNHEGRLIDLIQDAEGKYDGIILNPGAYAHYSYALADAIAAVSIAVAEVHISNIYKREEFRRNSVTAEHCIRNFVGLGLPGYRAALEYFIKNK